jgi:hypothetical protein
MMASARPPTTQFCYAFVAFAKHKSTFRTVTSVLIVCAFFRILFCPIFPLPIIAYEIDCK